MIHGETIQFCLKIRMRKLWLASGPNLSTNRDLCDGYESGGEDRRRERDAAVEATRDLLKLLAKELVGKDFLGGKSFGFVDIVANLVAFWLMRTEEIVGVKVVPVEIFPEIHRWVKNLLEIDVIKKCIPPEDEHLNYIKARMHRIKIKSV